MNRRLIAISLLVPFSALTVYAVAQVGYFGIFDYHRHSPAGWQVFTDLVIALILVMVWLIPEAKRRGRVWWPWLLVTVCTGSFGPLLYLALSPASDER